MSALHGLRLLVVEDEPLLLAALCKTLTNLGAVVVGRAATLEKGLELASTAEIDLGVIDVMLKEERSFPIVDALAERGIPYMFVTGYPYEVDLEGLFLEEVVVKPYLPGDLEQSAKRALERLPLVKSQEYWSRVWDIFLRRKV